MRCRILSSHCLPKAFTGARHLCDELFDREVMSWVATMRGNMSDLVSDVLLLAAKKVLMVCLKADDEIKCSGDNSSCNIAEETVTLLGA